MILKDLFGQKEEIENKNIIDEEIPINTRQKIFFVIQEYGYKEEMFGLGGRRVSDLNDLRYQICKQKEFIILMIMMWIINLSING